MVFLCVIIADHIYLVGRNNGIQLTRVFFKFRNFSWNKPDVIMDLTKRSTYALYVHFVMLRGWGK